MKSRIVESITAIVTVALLLAPKIAKLFRGDEDAGIDGGVIVAVARELEFHQERADACMEELQLHKAEIKRLQGLLDDHAK